MEMLITMKEFEKLTYNQDVPLKCQYCGVTFFRWKKFVKAGIKRGPGYHTFCSNECANKAQTTSQSAPCKQCGTLVKKLPSEIRNSKSGHVFCSHSCSATYNNIHKTCGYRKSKLEIYIEEMIRQEFPDLQILACDKTAINLELDLYFPELRFAIEFNGIFHYEPIYGKEKLERIQTLDKQRLILCYEAGIELCVIDTSSVGKVTKVVKEKYWDIVKNLLVPILGRKDSRPS